MTHSSIPQHAWNADGRRLAQTQDVRILLIEDNLGDARLVQILLDEAENPRFEITHAESLEDALGCLDTGRFDVVLADLSLPDSNGLETLRPGNN
ncbi:MAG: response regulator [Rubrobacteraceae bacterium]